LTETLTKPNSAETGRITYQDLKREAGGPVAKFFSNGTLKAYTPAEANDGRPRMKFVVSTTTTDLVGDIMSEAFIDKMLSQAIGKTFFVNHSYIIPQDVLGKVESGRKYTEKMTDPVTGEIGTYLMLEFVILVATSNPVAVKTYELVEKDEIKLGASVSIIILATSAGKNGTSIIQDGYYLETSAVGIPANQASWVQSIQKAFKEWERSGKAAPAENKPEFEQVSEKEQKQMSETTPAIAEQQIVTKNVFDDVIAFDTEMTCYDLSYSFCNAVSNLLDQAGGGYMADPVGMLDELLSDFAQAVKTLVGPILAISPTQVGEGKASGRGDTKVIASTLEQAKAYFTWQEKGVAPATTHKDSEAKPYQDMHDYLVSKGAACQHEAPNETDTTTTSADNKDVSQALTVNNKALELEITNLKTELAAAKTKSAQWEAISKKLKEKLEEYLKQPLSV
jgi:hypothetical protein